MFRTLAENAGTIAVSLALAGLVAWIIVRLRRNRKQGRSSCGGSCSCCPMSGSCHKAH
ncbi:MAG: FeoB-associated Cys-rich membrane protein [Clostridia bacterium]|nr:FeoB-associated Cys-rich membrane protein [Clostridia bacterium]